MKEEEDSPMDDVASSDARGCADEPAVSGGQATSKQLWLQWTTTCSTSTQTRCSPDHLEKEQERGFDAIPLLRAEDGNHHGGYKYLYNLDLRRVPVFSATRRKATTAATAASTASASLSQSSTATTTETTGDKDDDDDDEHDRRRQKRIIGLVLLYGSWNHPRQRQRQRQEQGRQQCQFQFQFQFPNEESVMARLLQSSVQPLLSQEEEEEQEGATSVGVTVHKPFCGSMQVDQSDDCMDWFVGDNNTNTDAAQRKNDGNNSTTTTTTSSNMMMVPFSGELPCIVTVGQSESSSSANPNGCAWKHVTGLRARALHRVLEMHRGEEDDTVTAEEEAATIAARNSTLADAEKAVRRAVRDLLVELRDGERLQQIARIRDDNAKNAYSYADAADADASSSAAPATRTAREEEQPPPPPPPPLRIFVAGDRSSVGKSSVCLGILGNLLRAGYHADELAYIKPATQSESRQLIQTYCQRRNVRCVPVGPVVYYRGFTRAFLNGQTQTTQELLHAAGRAVDECCISTCTAASAGSKNHHRVKRKVVLVDGVGFPAVGSICGTDNASVAAACGYPQRQQQQQQQQSEQQQQQRYPMGVVLVGGKGVGAAVDAFNLNRTYFEAKGVPVMGAIFNKLSTDPDDYYNLRNCKKAISSYFASSSLRRQRHRDHPHSCYNAFGFVPLVPEIAATDDDDNVAMDHVDDYLRIFGGHVDVPAILRAALRIQQQRGGAGTSMATIGMKPHETSTIRQRNDDAATVNDDNDSDSAMRNGKRKRMGSQPDRNQTTTQGEQQQQQQAPPPTKAAKKVANTIVRRTRADIEGQAIAAGAAASA